MLSLIVMFVLTVLVVYLADALTTHEGLAVALRLVAVAWLVLWTLHVFGAVRLPLEAW